MLFANVVYILCTQRHHLFYIYFLRRFGFVKPFCWFHDSYNGWSRGQITLYIYTLPIFRFIHPLCSHLIGQHQYRQTSSKHHHDLRKSSLVDRDTTLFLFSHTKSITEMPNMQLCQIPRPTWDKREHLIN